ncbi:MAG: hypothetical protein K1X64_20490 [Myxococcaceae bacterium]|nr:hypothetical protein [Myxococcaceae bacterium]
MNSRISTAFFACAASFLLLGCPAPSQKDGGTDEEFDGSVKTGEGCTGGCPANKVCDAAKRVCVDPCGACLEGGICQKDSMGAWACVKPQTSCNGTTCGEGEIACVEGQCSCLGPSRASEDSCAAFGKVCNAGKCQNPKRFEVCDPAKIDVSPCPQNHTCHTVFGKEGEEGSVAFCTPNCNAMSMTQECDFGTLCSDIGCLPQAFFQNGDCGIQVTVPLADGGVTLLPDGGILLRENLVAASNVCQLKDNGGVFTEATPTGNCTYTFFRLKEEERYKVASCRRPGTATEGQRCKNDYRPTALATQCGTGLDCFINKGDEGVCLRMCNAIQPLSGPLPPPVCGADETCVNVFRVEDSSANAVEGMCMKKCNVFDAAKNTCADVGASAASCVPTPADGHAVITNDGTGACIPRQATIAALGAQCASTDPFTGAVCGNAQVCVSSGVSDKPVCAESCDVECNPSDAGVPSRCATQPHARCSGGKICTSLSAPFNARLGLCR